MTTINYLIRQDITKVKTRKQFRVRNGFNSDTGAQLYDNVDGVRCSDNMVYATPVECIKLKEEHIIENPILVRLRKKFKQAKIRISERAFHMHGVPYVQLMSV